MVLRLRALALGACAAIALAAACGGPSLPPDLTESNDGGGEWDVTAGLIPDSTSPPPACPKLIGPDGGVCACLEQSLLVDAPSIYFMLDRSGSMNDSGKWGTVQTVIGKVMVALGPRALFGAAVFPASYDNTGCTPGNEVFKLQPGDAPAGVQGPVTTALLNTLHRIPAAGGTPTAATVSGLTNHLLGLPNRAYVILATDGGPNCNAKTQCAPATCTYNIDAVQGCSPSTNCCDPMNGGTWLACLDAQPTVAAVQTLANDGIPVYVVGIPGSEPYATLLDNLALAGGTGRGGTPEYYPVTSADEAAFEATLRKIAAKITGTCTFDLGTVPPDPSLMNVFLNEQLLPQQLAGGGWSLMGSKLTILGSSCQEILNGDVLDIRVFAGCPTVLR